jgi:hypothetical protein
VSRPAILIGLRAHWSGLTSAAARKSGNEDRIQPFKVDDFDSGRKKIRAAGAKEVGMKNPIEKATARPNQNQTIVLT